MNEHRINKILVYSIPEAIGLSNINCRWGARIEGGIPSRPELLVVSLESSSIEHADRTGVHKEYMTTEGELDFYSNRD